MRSIKLSKKEYAIGFWWQIHEGKGKKQLLEKAKSVAEGFSDRNYNCVVPRKQQFGLGSCEDTKIKRLPSLACALVERSRSTWIGLFCLNQNDDLWWVCAVSKKIIVAEGDQFFTSRATAEAHLRSLKSLTTWKNEIICVTEEESLNHFDGLLKISEKVQPLCPEKSNLKFIIAAALVCAACTGWYMWNSHQEELFREQQRRIALEARRKAKKQQETIKQDPQQMFTMHWKETSLPSEFAYEFLRAVQNTETYTLGWKLNSIVRNADGIYMSWLHQEGAKFTNRPQNSTFGTRPELADITINYPDTVKRPSQNLIKKDVASAQLYELTRTLSARLVLNWKAPEIQKLDNKILKKAVAVTAPWVMGDWKITSLPAGAIISEELFTELDRIPCLVLSKINFTNNQCTMEGQIYASY